jgi:tetratricopeptide (TPR) repeat protein
MSEPLHDQSVEQALDYYQNGNHEAAHALYARMLADEPNNHEVLYMLSLCRQKQGQLDNAADYLRQAIELQPSSSLFHYSMGGLNMRLGHIEEARESYRQAAELSPNEAKAWLGYGYALLTLGRLEEADEALRTARRAVRNDAATEATICAHLGVVELQRDRPDQALPKLQQAVELNPEDVYCQTQLGRAFLLAGQAGFAAQCFSNAKTLQQGAYAHETQLNYWHAQALEQTGDVDAALAIWRSLLSSGTDSPEVFIGAAQAYLHSGLVSQALSLLGKAHVAQPDNAEIIRLLGQCYLRRGQLEDCIKMLQQCPASDRAAQRLLLRAYLNAKRFADAHYLGQQLQADGDDEDYLLAAQAAVAHAQADAAHQALNQLSQRQQEQTPARWLRCMAHAQVLFADATAAIDLPQLDQDLQDLAAHDDINAELHRAILQLRARGQHHAANHAVVLQLLDDLPRQPAQILNSINDRPDGDSLDPLASLPPTPEQLFNADVIRSWPPSAPGGVRLQPVFVLGWPGSGRRQLLQALNLHSDIDCLLDRPLQSDESPLRYGGALERLRQLTWPRDPDELSSLTEADWLAMRQGYKKRVVQELGHHPEAVLVDALELPVQALLSVQRVFPQATVIMLNATIEQLMLSWHWSGFEDLELMRSLWQTQQQYWRQAQQTLQLRIIEVDSRQLLADPQPTLTSTLQSLSLDWQPAMLRAFSASPLYPPLHQAEQYHAYFN